MQLGRTISLDPKNGQLRDDDAKVSRMLARPYRGDWPHPGGAGSWKPWTAADARPSA
jgi:hypothetical protein